MPLGKQDPTGKARPMIDAFTVHYIICTIHNVPFNQMLIANCFKET
jgi:hypothetical protein